MKNKLFAGAVTLTALSLGATEIPWQDGFIVFDSTHEGQSFTLDDPASAKGVRFGGAATLRGATLTLTDPAVVNGIGGAVLNPLSGNSGLAVGYVLPSTEFFASTDYRTVWRNMRLADVQDATGCLCGGWGARDGKANPAETRFFKKSADGSSATLQLAAWYPAPASFVRAAKILLRQNGSDVEAKCEWIRYSTDIAMRDVDWDVTPPTGTTDYYQPPYAQQVTAVYSIGVTDVRPLLGDFVFEGPLPAGTIENNAGRLIVRPKAGLSLANAVKGRGGAFILQNQALPHSRRGDEAGWVTTKEFLIAEDAGIDCVELVSAYMLGPYVNADSNDPKYANKFGSWGETAGNVRRFQVQVFDGDYTKVVELALRQDGTKIWAKGVKTFYTNGDRRGNCVSSNEGELCTAGNPYTREGLNGSYGIWNICFAFRPEIRLENGFSNGMSTSTRFELDGVKVRAYHPNAFCSGQLVVLTNSATLFIHDASGNAYRGANVFVAEDCRLSTGSEWVISPDSQFIVNGGEFQMDHVGYVSRVVLSNGGEVKGAAKMRMGWYRDDCSIRTLAGEDCYVRVPIDGVRHQNDSSDGSLKSWVDFDLAAPLHLQGKLGSASVGGGWSNWRKTGQATLHLEGAGGTSVGRILIEQGTVSFDADHVVGDGTPVTLAGGNLSVGTCANENLGALEVTADSTLNVNDQGVLAFADSTAASWTGGLAVVGEADELKPGLVRFNRASAGAGLSAAQLRKIRYNGKGRVTLDADGWLVSRGNGLLLLFR